MLQKLGFSALKGEHTGLKVSSANPAPITGLFSCRSRGAMLSRRPRSLGEVPERSNGAVSKTSYTHAALCCLVPISAGLRAVRPDIGDL
jgi:hypothetical protein